MILLDLEPLTQVKVSLKEIALRVTQIDRELTRSSVYFSRYEETENFRCTNLILNYNISHETCSYLSSPRNYTDTDEANDSKCSKFIYHL